MPEEIKKCPNCGRPLVQRQGKFGMFWGCSGYPQCKFILKKQDQAQQILSDRLDTMAKYLQERFDAIDHKLQDLLEKF